MNVRNKKQNLSQLGSTFYSITSCAIWQDYIVKKTRGQVQWEEHLEEIPVSWNIEKVVVICQNSFVPPNAFRPISKQENVLHPSVLNTGSSYGHL